MKRGSYFSGALAAGILGTALIAGVTVGRAEDAPKLALSGSATFTTDYMFRSVSNTSQNPAVQPEIDLTYGIFWAYIWGSNTNVVGSDALEIDYGAGISPKWND